MKRKTKKVTLASLVGANALLLGLLLGAQDAAADGDFCDEQTANGCACQIGSAWLPNGCHESAAPVFDCSDGTDCGIMT